MHSVARTRPIFQVFAFKVMIDVVGYLKTPFITEMIGV